MVTRSEASAARSVLEEEVAQLAFVGSALSCDEDGSWFVHAMIEDEESAHEIPDEIDGVPIKCTVTGEFQLDG